MTKYFITVFRNGKKEGYIKSASYKTRKFTITDNRLNAKKYKSVDMVSSDIDYIAYEGLSMGYVFSYSELR